MACGLIPTSWFLWRFRPAWPIRRPSLIINGLVLVAWLTYVRSATIVITRGGAPAYRGVFDAVISLAFGALVDGLLILMLVTFLRYRSKWHAERGNDGKEMP